MAKQKKRRLDGFRAFLLIYALIFLALLPALLRPLWNYLAEYEQSGPDRAMERYLDSMDEAATGDIAEALEELNAEFEDALFMLEEIDLKGDDWREEFMDALDEFQALAEDYARYTSVASLAERMKLLVQMARKNLVDV